MVIQKIRRANEKVTSTDTILHEACSKDTLDVKNRVDKATVGFVGLG